MTEQPQEISEEIADQIMDLIVQNRNMLAESARGIESALESAEEVDAKLTALTKEILNSYHEMIKEYDDFIKKHQKTA